MLRSPNLVLALALVSSARFAERGRGGEETFPTPATDTKIPPVFRQISTHAQTTLFQRLDIGCRLLLNLLYVLGKRRSPNPDT